MRVGIIIWSYNFFGINVFRMYLVVMVIMFGFYLFYYYVDCISIIVESFEKIVSFLFNEFFDMV